MSERKVYICYSSKVAGGSSTTLMAGTLKEDKLISKKILFKSNNVSESGVHFGCRLAILNDEIFMSIGDRGNRYEAQDVNSHAGSVIRVINMMVLLGNRRLTIAGPQKCIQRGIGILKEWQ